MMGTLSPCLVELMLSSSVRVAICTTLPLFFAASCDGPADIRQASPSAVLTVSGDEQNGIVGQELPAPLVARVVDSDGRPVSGQLVNFVVTAGEGSLFTGSALTTEDGTVQNRWTLGIATTDQQRVQARVIKPETGEPIFGTFVATALADNPHEVSRSGEGSLEGVAGSELTDSLLAKITDQFGNPVPGVIVDWSVIAGEGSISPVQSTTNSEGNAAALWTLGGEAGAQEVGAAVQNVGDVRFLATAVAGNPAAIEKISGDGQEGEVGTTLQDPLVVRVLDRYDNPISGVQINWRVETGGGSISPVQTTTDALGEAQTEWTLGPEDGEARASLDALEEEVVFSATVSGPQGTLAFDTDTGEGRHIHLIYANGEGLTQLTTGSSGSGGAAWSPDGQQIAFVTGRHGSSDIYVMNADGSNQRRLTNDEESGGDLSWSPDGTRIAFASYHAGNSDVWIMNAQDGSEKVRLTDAEEDDVSPTWSLDGLRLAFERRHVGSDGIMRGAIHTVAVDGTEGDVLTDSGWDHSPAWSPDGARIAFLSSRDDASGGTLWELYVMNADGTGQTRLTDMIGADGTVYLSRGGPSWSSDGARIAFTAHTSAGSGIRYVESDGSGLVIVTTEDDHSGPAWRPY